MIYISSLFQFGRYFSCTCPRRKSSELVPFLWLGLCGFLFFPSQDCFNGASCQKKMLTVLLPLPSAIICSLGSLGYRIKLLRIKDSTWFSVSIYIFRQVFSLLQKKKPNILARRTRSVESVLRYVLRSRSLTRSPSLLAPLKLARVSYAVACPSLPLSSATARPPHRKMGPSASLPSRNIFPHASAPDRPHLPSGIRLTPPRVNCTVTTPRKPCILASSQLFG